MLHLQLRKLFNHLVCFNARQSFFFKLIVIVFIIHLLFLATIFLLYKSTHDHERFDIAIKPETSLIVLCPLQKKVEQKISLKKETPGKQQSTKVIDYQEYEQRKKEQKTKAQKKQLIEKKSQPKVPERKEIPVKKTIIKHIEKKSAKSATSLQKKMASKSKIAQKVELEVTGHELLQEHKEEHKEQVKEPSVEKENKLAVEQKPKELEEKPVEKSLEKQQEEPIDVDDVTFIGYEQLETMVISQQIQSSVAKYFKPPIGVAKTASCELSVFVDAQGQARGVKVKRSSKIPAFDISARSCMQHITFPKEVRNKTIIIVLGQS